MADAHDHAHHGHAHGHVHAPPGASPRAFAWAIGLNAGYVVVEVIVGLAIGSLGLVADAGHNASDVLSLVVAWIGASLATRAPSGRFTYGWKRSPILASLFNALLLFGAMAVVAFEAVRRLQQPVAVPGLPIVLVTLVGLAVNGGTAMLFFRGRDDLNTRGAYLHMLADAGVTFAVLLAGIGIALTGATWLDPVVTLAVVAVVLWSGWSLFAEAMRRSLDAVPSGLDLEAIRRALVELEPVEDVHDLHVWGYSTTEVALTAHLVTHDPLTRPNGLLHRACAVLDERFGIRHTTLQLETRGGTDGEPSDPCGLRDPARV